jgi:hypothetical protein
MESVADLLGQYNPDGPNEVLAVKRYIEKEFQSGASVSIRNETIVVTVASASLANALRLRINQLRAAAGTKKRVMFRIG